MAIDTLLFERLVQAAGSAPSSHNTQPWRFAHAGRAIDVFADRGRALPVNDPHDRELTISCGCALATLEYAADALGLAPRVEPFPDGVDADLLARVTLQPQALRAGAEPPAAIAQRRTWRGDVEPDAPGPALQACLREVASAHGCSLHVIGADARGHVAALVEAGDRAQWDDPRWRRELALWMRTRPSPDGLAVPGGVAPLTRAIVRAADLGGPSARATRPPCATRPGLAFSPRTTTIRPPGWPPVARCSACCSTPRPAASRPPTSTSPSRSRRSVRRSRRCAMARGRR